MTLIIPVRYDQQPALGSGGAPAALQDTDIMCVSREGAGAVPPGAKTPFQKFTLLQLKQYLDNLDGGANTFQGSWNAADNIPALSSGSGAKGEMYLVSVAGNTPLDGILNYAKNDFIVSDGNVWLKVSNEALVQIYNEPIIRTLIIAAQNLNLGGKANILVNTLNQIDITAGETLGLEGSAIGMTGKLEFSKSTVTGSAITSSLTNSLIAVTTLPAANVDITLSDTDKVADRTFTIKDESGNAGTNRIRVIPESGNLDGVSYLDIIVPYGFLTVYNDGTNWFTR